VNVMPSFRSRTYESVLGATPVVDGARVRTDLDWKEQVQYLGKPTNISASIDAGSMIHADGHFLCLGDNGHLLWLDCSPVGTPVLARAKLFGANETWTPPVLSRGLLYAGQNKRERSVQKPARLLCFDLRRGQ